MKPKIQALKCVTYLKINRILVTVIVQENMIGWWFGTFLPTDDDQSHEVANHSED